jgi:hypothetical protein
MAIKGSRLPIVLVAVLSTVAASPVARAAGSDPRAMAIADRVMQALGGEAAWNATRYLRFDFAVDREGKPLMRRAHAWDKWTGRHRVAGKDKDGRDLAVAMNLNTKQGSASLAGAPLAGKELEKALETGYAWWVNDSYWLVMPYSNGGLGLDVHWMDLAALFAVGGVYLAVVFFRMSQHPLIPVGDPRLEDALHHEVT